MKKLALLPLTLLSIAAVSLMSSCASDGEDDEAVVVPTVHSQTTTTETLHASPSPVYSPASSSSTITETTTIR